MYSKTIQNFLEISKYPRPSGNEVKVRDYLISWAISKGFDNKVDKAGNLMIYIPATSDKIGHEAVILQAHMDMVCVKTEDSNHDFLNDPIEVIEENGFLSANNTTLGGDNGIGMALAMTAAEFKSHPPLELVFTVEEEIGLIGAKKLDFKLLSGKVILNADSGNEEEICISSAGGVRFDMQKKIEYKNSKYPQYKFEIFGMKGGHSGIEIDKNQGNAINVFVDFFSNCGLDYEISYLDSGTADNAIPLNIKSVIGVEKIEIFEDLFIDFLDNVKKKYDCPEIAYSLENEKTEHKVIENIKLIFETISVIKIGVYNFSEKIPNLVQTSNSLGILKIENDIIKLIYMARSSIGFELEAIINNVLRISEQNKFSINIGEPYLGWQENPNCDLILIAKDEFRKIIKKEIKTVAHHAGLEPGILVAGLQAGAHAISIGPNMHDIHTVNERIEIESVEKMEKILENILKRL